MDIQEWWPRLSITTQQHLAENNGDLIPSSIVEEIRAAGGDVIQPDSADSQESGFTLPDEVTDWIEAAANGEHG